MSDMQVAHGLSVEYLVRRNSFGCCELACPAHFITSNVARVLAWCMHIALQQCYIGQTLFFFPFLTYAVS